MDIQNTAEDELLTQVAHECAVPVELLQKLAGLQLDVPDLNIWGAKPKLGRLVAEVLDEEGARRRYA